jgi:hypothetical protein
MNNTLVDTTFATNPTPPSALPEPLRDDRGDVPG